MVCVWERERKRKGISGYWEVERKKEGEGERMIKAKKSCKSWYREAEKVKEKERKKERKKYRESDQGRKVKYSC